MLDPFNPDEMGDETATHRVGPPRRRAWIFWAAGAVAVAVAVAAVVIGSTGSATATDIVPGVNQPTAGLLQLDSTADEHLTAPPFTLTDQNGKPMSLSDYRGKAVVLTFNDDQCTDLCTLLAQDVLAADRDLGAAQNKIAFVSINANPYYPMPATVKQWTDQHGLGHTANWHYGTADPATLSRIADTYGVPIELDPKDKTIEHGTEIFFISPDGKEVRLGEFGTESADTAPFGHAMAQVADDLLPAGQRTHIAGAGITAPSTGSTQLNATPAPIELPVLGTPSTRYSTKSQTGEYTVLNFWASTCIACTAETPALESEYKALDGKVAFVGIDVADKTTAGSAFARRFGVTYPLLADEDGKTAGAFAISGLPYTVILNSKGKVLVRHPGAFTREQLDYLLRSLDVKLTAAG
jgi:Uncharacterized protein SCO1/SenC/PrrC, involved in biogenesis of respiratory and photosynthetic systems